MVGELLCIYLLYIGEGVVDSVLCCLSISLETCSVDCADSDLNALSLEDFLGKCALDN